ncbi:MAG: response regulator [Desertifilum sp. SIO1I2]|nr:response regulator [Desertifilum sp. SIO1I2]
MLVGAALLQEQPCDRLSPDEQALIGFYLDLSDRKQVERALRESEERLHLILDASALGMWYCDLPLNVLLCNKTCKEHLGLPPQGEVTIDLFYACLHPDDRESTRQGIEKAIGDRTPYDAEFRTRGPDGHLRWVRVKGQIFNDPTSGRPYRFDGITIDITAAKQAEAERELLLARRSQYALQLHGLTHASMVMNASLSVESVLRSITEQARAIIGAHQAIARVTLNGETLISCSLAERHAAWQGAEHHLELLHLQPDEPLNQSLRMTQDELSGDPRWQALAQQQYSLPMHGWLAAPLRIQGDRLIGSVQLSEKIEGEFNEEDEAIVVQLAQIAAVAIENTRLYEAEQRARTHAEEANRIKDEFLAVLSHELRTPLNPILGWVKLLRTRQMDEAKVARALETIERNASLQAQLIEDLLDVSRILRGKINLAICSVNLQAVVEAALDMVRLAAQAKGIEIDTQFVSGLPTISGDPNRLQQVVCNLLSNAVKFTPNGGRVSVQLWADGSFVKIQIQDNGAGINPHFLPYVFDYFRQQNSSSNRAFGGLGLGLAIVRYLVELHGGTAIAQSPGEGQGAIFTVAFPLMPPSSNDWAAERVAPVELASTPAFSSLQGLRILVVDDEVDTRELLIFTLEQYGAQVLAVGSAQVAINCIASSESQFDLLLSDIGMPEMDGYQLIHQVRSLPPAQGGNILAIALTAYAGHINRQQILQAGFQAHLAKPIEPAALAVAIVNLLASQPQLN